MYPLDSAIHLLNNWGLVDTTLVASTLIKHFERLSRKALLFVSLNSSLWINKIGHFRVALARPSVDCKTVAFFLNRLRKSFTRAKRASLTRPTGERFLQSRSRPFVWLFARTEYAKIRTVLQSRPSVKPLIREWFFIPGEKNLVFKRKVLYLASF